MKKRGMVFGGYDTATYGWTLLPGWLFSPAEQKTNFADVPGGDGSLDLSTSLTDGIPKYKDRTLTAVFELSAGDRLTRETKIRQMVNLLDGMRLDIKLPDDDEHHITGLVHVARDYNDLAHAAITVTAICKPWKFANAETSVTVTATETPETVHLVNNGRRVVVPTLHVEGDNGQVLLRYGDASLSLSNGTYQWPELLLTPGVHDLTCEGKGILTVSYREAVLE